MAKNWSTIYIDKDNLALLKELDVKHHWLPCKTNSDKIFALADFYQKNWWIEE
jgi:hypothetical protein